MHQHWPSFLEIWVIVGLVGAPATIALGSAVLAPQAKKVEASYASGGVRAPVVGTCREMLVITKFDLVLLFTIVANMVLKPQPSGWATLLIMAIVVPGRGRGVPAAPQVWRRAGLGFNRRPARRSSP